MKYLYLDQNILWRLVNPLYFHGVNVKLRHYDDLDMLKRITIHNTGTVRIYTPYLHMVESLLKNWLSQQYVDIHINLSDVTVVTASIALELSRVACVQKIIVDESDYKRLHSFSNKIIKEDLS